MRSNLIFPQGFCRIRFCRPVIVFSAVSLLSALLGCGSGESSTPTLSIEATGNTSAGSQSEKPTFNFFPEVEVKTSSGAFTLKLDAHNAPLTVSNFLFYVNRGLYNGTIFHEVNRDFMMLGGGFDVNSVARPAEMSIRNEAHSGLKNRRGTIAMARQPDAIDSATNQFFINLADNSSLDYAGQGPSQYGYCVFGEVISGSDVLDRINQVSVQRTEQFANAPVKPVVIEAMRQTK